MYLAAQGARFERTVVAHAEESQIHGRAGGGEVVPPPAGSETALEKAWASFVEQRNFNDTEKLFDAIYEGDLAEVQLFVWMGIDVEAQRFQGKAYPPIYLAVSCNEFNMMKYFVELGYDKDVGTSDGWTPLMEACAYNLGDIAEYLLDQGCNADLTDIDGTTALHMAAAGSSLEVAQLLFRYGAKLDIRDNNGETPADIATRLGNHAFADALRAEEIRRRDHGFKRDPSTIEGTEEHEAAKRPRVEQEPAAAEVGAKDESDDDDDDDEDDDDEEG